MVSCFFDSQCICTEITSHCERNGKHWYNTQSTLLTNMWIWKRGVQNPTRATWNISLTFAQRYAKPANHIKLCTNVRHHVTVWHSSAITSAGVGKQFLLCVCITCSGDQIDQSTQLLTALHCWTATQHVIYSHTHNRLTALCPGLPR